MVHFANCMHAELTVAPRLVDGLAFRSRQASSSSCEWPSFVFGKRSWRLSVRQWMPSQSRDFCADDLRMRQGAHSLFLLVRGPSRNQLFETMKKGGAAVFESVVMPQGSRAMHRPVVGLCQGRRREHNIAVETQKVRGQFMPELRSSRKPRRG